MVKEKEETTEEESKDNYILKNVVTQTEVGIGNKDDDGIFTDKEILLLILNKLDKVIKGVAWLV